MTVSRSHPKRLKGGSMISSKRIAVILCLALALGLAGFALAQ
jgi:hypothetical protein